MAYYRLYFFNPRSHGIVSFEEIDAASDEEAKAEAESAIGSYALELWCGARKAAAYEATDMASRVLAARRASAQEQSR